MISSPWAMLMTFIRPNENVSPMAISRRIEPRLTALKPCESQMDKLFPPPRVDQTKTVKGRPRLFLEAALMNTVWLLLLLLHELGAPGVRLQVRVGLDRSRRGR